MSSLQNRKNQPVCSPKSPVYVAFIDTDHAWFKEEFSEKEWEFFKIEFQIPGFEVELRGIYKVLVLKKQLRT